MKDRWLDRIAQRLGYQRMGDRTLTITCPPPFGVDAACGWLADELERIAALVRAGYVLGAVKSDVGAALWTRCVFRERNPIEETDR